MNIKEEAMRSDDLFSGMDSTERAILLCQLLVRYKSQIESQLTEVDKYKEFCDRIASWDAQYLKGPWESSESSEEVEEALYDICREFGVIQFVLEERLVDLEREAPLRTKGPIRAKTRGEGVSPDELRREMKEVARCYGYYVT